MEKLEPIDLLKQKLAEFEKAIDKCTISNYSTVSANLNPWIEKYKKAIKRLQVKHIKETPLFICKCHVCKKEFNSTDKDFIICPSCYA